MSSPYRSPPLRFSPWVPPPKPAGKGKPKKQKPEVECSIENSVQDTIHVKPLAFKPPLPPGPPPTVPITADEQALVDLFADEPDVQETDTSTPTLVAPNVDPTASKDQVESIETLPTMQRGIVDEDKSASQDAPHDAEPVVHSDEDEPEVVPTVEQPSNPVVQERLVIRDDKPAHFANLEYLVCA
jgi:hypothetical protein